MRSPSEAAVEMHFAKDVEILIAAHPARPSFSLRHILHIPHSHVPYDCLSPDVSGALILNLVPLNPLIRQWSIETIKTAASFGISGNYPAELCPPRLVELCP